MSVFGIGRGDAGSGQQLFQMLAEVRAYWDGLGDGTHVPLRDQIDPRGIAGALENTFLVERAAPGVARFRLAGMQLHDLMGMDVRGMPLTALIEPACRIRLSAAVETVFANPAIAEISLEGVRGIGRPPLQARMILLPLISIRGVTDLALGCLAMAGGTGRAPRRFAISGLRSEATGRRDDALRRNTRETVPGMAESITPFTTDCPRTPRCKPYLRLVASRD